MTKFQDALSSYLATHVPRLAQRSRSGATTYSYENLDVRHEEGWSNDSGTSWPAAVYITFLRVHRNAEGKQTGSRRGEVYVHSDPIEFMRELIEGPDHDDE